MRYPPVIAYAYNSDNHKNSKYLPDVLALKLYIFRDRSVTENIQFVIVAMKSFDKRAFIVVAGMVGVRWCGGNNQPNQAASQPALQLAGCLIL